MSTGIEHFRKAEEILEGMESLAGHMDADWTIANAARAQAHATLALASRNFAELSPRFEPEEPTERTIIDNAGFVESWTIPEGEDGLEEWNQ